MMLYILGTCSMSFVNCFRDYQWNIKGQAIIETTLFITSERVDVKSILQYYPWCLSISLSIKSFQRNVANETAIRSVTSTHNFISTKPHEKEKNLKTT